MGSEWLNGPRLFAVLCGATVGLVYTCFMAGFTLIRASFVIFFGNIHSPTRATMSNGDKMNPAKEIAWFVAFFLMFIALFALMQILQGAIDHGQ